MARRVFFSFHFGNDAWRVAQIKNIGALDRNAPVTVNEWEEVKKGGERAIKKWIDDNMFGRSCVVVLIGSETYARPWVLYELQKAWNDGKGIVGIHIHNLLNQNQETSLEGPNPLDYVHNGTTPLSRIFKTYRTRATISTSVYAQISNNIDTWVEDAIEIRNQYQK